MRIVWILSGILAFSTQAEALGLAHIFKAEPLSENTDWVPTTEDLEWQWGRFFKDYSRIKEPTAPQSDFTLVYELNLQAAALWAKMLSCLSDRNGATIQIKDRFYQKNICAKTSDNRLLLQEIRDYRRQVHTYLNTADVGYSLSFLEERTETYPAIHPLFTEMLLMEWNDLDYPANSERREDLWKYSQNAFATLGNLSDSNCNQWGLWPAATGRLLNTVVAHSAEKLDRASVPNIESKIWNRFQRACRDVRLEPNLEYPRGSLVAQDREILRAYEKLAKEFK
jgi:hypothetical protein